MRSTRRCALVSCAVFALLLLGSPPGDLRAAAGQPPTLSPEFHRDIQPILVEACAACHGPSEATRQVDLRLDTPDFIGSVVVPGDAEGSLLFQRLTTDEPIGRMPPSASGQSLSADQIELVRLWINSGAALGTEAADAGATSVATRTVDFAREVRPILSENCFTCHGPDGESRQRGLRLDVAEGPFADRGEFGGPVIIRGNAADSLLFHRVTAADLSFRMPYRRGLASAVMPGGDPLTDEEIETLRLWVDQGAEWQSHWAFIPPERPPVPQVANPEWVRNPIDNFVLTQLEDEGRTPAEEADLLTLLRRVTLDLTGLPPTGTQIAAVLSDDAPDAYERHVDRLLASTGYGERMAVVWLDGARYADSSGYQTDAPREMWRYRDWVIDAYNENMPFDQFTIEQIAGDMLPDARLDQRIATAFNRNHSQNGEGGIIPEEFLVENVVDRVSTTGTVWMGLTLGCARCHDHKFDPLTQKEFYEIYAYFNNIPERGNLRGLGAKAFKYFSSPPVITAPTEENDAELAEFDGQLDEAREAFSSLWTDAAAAQTEWESSLRSAWQVDWVLRDQLLVHYPLDGDIAGVYAGNPPPVSQGVTAHLRAPRQPVTVTFPVNVTLEDGQPLFAPGRVGEAMSFDGQRFINAGDIANFTYADPFTLAAWIYPTAADGVIVSRALAGDQGEQGWGLYLLDGKLQVNLSQRYADDGLRIESRDVLPLNEWQHVLVTYDGKRVPEGFRIYVNGQSRQITPLLDGINNPMRTRQPLRIGASGSAPGASGATDSRPRFQGMIDDVHIYTTALTPKQAAVVATGDSLSEIARIPPSSRTAGQTEKLRLAFLDQYAAQPLQESLAQGQGPGAPARRALGELPDRDGDGGDGAAARHVPADSWRVRRSGGEGGSRRAGGAAAPCRRSRERPSGIRPLARPTRPPAHRPGGREPLLADVLRDRPRQDGRELRAARRISEPSGAAGLVGHDLHRFRVGRQGDAAGDRDERHLPPVVEAHTGGARGRPREPPAGAWAASTAPGADDPRPGALGRRVARRQGRRAVGQAVSARGPVGGTEQSGLQTV